MSDLYPRHTKSNYLGIAAVLLSGAAIPISTATQNIGAALLILTFFLIPKTWHQLKNIFVQPFAIAGISLGLMLALGTFWSSASITDAWGFFLKMRAYYLIPIFLLVLNRRVNQLYLLFSFAAITLISVILSCGSAFFNYPLFMAIPGDWYIFRTHTYHNFFAALLGSGILSLLITKKTTLLHKFLLLSVLLIISYDILFLVAGRTGQLTYFAMIGLILLLWNWRVGLTIGLVLVAASIVILPTYSPAFNAGLKGAEANLDAYAKGDANTSVGLRLEWQKNSIRLITEKPILGHGTGSFKGEYARILGSGDYALISKNPHNDYLWLGVELGIIGVLLLPTLMLAAAWQGRHLEPAWRWTLYSLLIGMALATTANSFFTDNITGLAFVLLASALLSGPIIPKKLP